MLSVKGALTYRARIALPPETRAVVELKDTSVADGRVVAEQRMDLGGKQVPIPFVLTVDRSKLLDGKQYSVRGAFQVQGRATWVSDPVVITASAGVDRRRRARHETVHGAGVRSRSASAVIRR